MSRTFLCTALAKVAGLLIRGQLAQPLLLLLLQLLQQVLILHLLILFLHPLDLLAIIDCLSQFGQKLLVPHLHLLLTSLHPLLLLLLKPFHKICRRLLRVLMVLRARKPYLRQRLQGPLTLLAHTDRLRPHITNFATHFIINQH